MNKLSIVGFHQATIVRDIYNLACELNYIVEIVDPHKFLDGNWSKDSRVLVGITLDKDLRKQVIEYIDLNNVDRATIIHPTALVDASAVIGPGTFFGPYSSVFSSMVSISKLSFLNRIGNLIVFIMILQSHLHQGSHLIIQQEPAFQLPVKSMLNCKHPRY